MIDPASLYPHTFSRTRIGDVELRNRVFVSAHTTNFGEEFLPTQRHVDYHRERARGGVGLIITEPLRVHETSLGRSGGIAADRAGLPVLSRIVEAVREEGAAIFTQITHAGRHSDNVFRRAAAWGPSERPWHVTGARPHAMTHAEIREVTRAYADAAILAVDAGYQGVEIHFGHGHLLHQFLSPLSNTRLDEYGGSPDGRMRFPLEVLDAVLSAAAGRAVVGVRMSCEELAEGGLDLADGIALAQLLCEDYPIGFLNLSVAAYTVPSIGHHVADMSEGRTPYVSSMATVAEVAGSVPVLAACRFLELEDVERTLRRERFTALAMTRAHIADPHIVRKTLEGTEKRVRPCVSCNFCIGEIGAHRPMTCMMNPAVGKEASWPVVPEPSPIPRRVIVLGGGPAGLETARVAAERGHQVTLWETADDVGGQVRIGQRAAGRGDLRMLVTYQKRELERLGVAVRTQVPAEESPLESSGADVVVVATGARIERGEVPGWGPTLTVDEVLEGRDWVGRVAVIIDVQGSWATSSVAETVARGGAVVHVVTAATSPLWGVTEYSRMTAMERLRLLGVRFWTGSTVAFGDRSAEVRLTLSDATVALGEIDDVITVDHPRAQAEVLQRLAGSAVEVHVIGDASAPRSLLEAMTEGHALARSL